MKCKTVRLEDVCLSISDGDHQAPPKVNHGIPFVTISNINASNKFDFTDVMYVPSNYYDGLDAKRKPQKNDILYSVVGSFGIPVFMDSDMDFVFQRHIAILKPNEERIVPKYLYYVMCGREFYAQADTVAIGVAQRTISLSSLRRMKINIPSIEVQCKITDILAQYDCLIENNNKRIKILEQMAENLYKEWFVRFRFPGYETAEFVDGVPKGWKVVKLGNVASVSTGKCNRQDAEDDGEYPLFDRSQQIKKSSVWIKDCEAIIVPGEGTSFVPRYYVGKFNLHQRCYCVEPMYDGVGKFLFYMLKHNSQYFFSVATGATVPSLRLNNFTMLKFTMPDKKVSGEFDEIITGIFKLIDSLEKQNQNIAKQRDYLLPRLMGGKLQVK